MDVKAVLRGGASKKKLIGFFALAIKHKPRRHQMSGNNHGKTGRGIYAIGG